VAKAKRDGRAIALIEFAKSEATLKKEVQKNIPKKQHENISFNQQARIKIRS